MEPLLVNLNRRFDHAALRPEVVEGDIVRLCGEAVEYGLFAVCVNPVWVARCREELGKGEVTRSADGIERGVESGFSEPKLLGTRPTNMDPGFRRDDTVQRDQAVRIVSVAGFPLGASRTEVKVEEAARAVADGAHEIDMVANIGWIRNGRMAEVAAEIRAVREALPYNVVLKVIIEAGLLSPASHEADTSQQERASQHGADTSLLVAATEAVVQGGAQFVKTSTGFFGGATVEQVAALDAAAGGRIEVKASGGIRTLEDCERMIRAGATRLGSSSSAAILRELRGK